MKVTVELMNALTALYEDKGDGVIVAKDVFLMPDIGPKLLNVLRAYAERPAFGKFTLDADLIAKVSAAQKTATTAVAKPAKAVKAPKPAKAPKATKAPKEVEPSDAELAEPPVKKTGVRAKTQMAKLNKMLADANVGEVMYEKDLIERGAVQISQAEARSLVKEGSTVYAIDRNFSTGIVVPPLATDLTLTNTKTEFYRLP